MLNVENNNNKMEQHNTYKRKHDKYNTKTTKKRTQHIYTASGICKNKKRRINFNYKYFTILYTINTKKII